MTADAFRKKSMPFHVHRLHEYSARYQLLIVLLLTWMAGILPLEAQDLTVKAYVDRTTVGVNEQFTLNVELSGSDLNAASNPELPDMEDFAAFLGSGSSQNMQYINGRMSVSKSISYHFQAIQEGDFEIGPVLVKAKGKSYRTDPIAIKVQKTSTQPGATARPQARDAGAAIAEDDLFLRVSVDKKRVFQNEPVTVTYKIYTRVNVGSFGFANMPGTTGFWVEEFETGRQPVTSTEVLGGKQYTVATVRRIALFPMTPGEKTIDPLAVECEVRVQRRSRSLFDDFFNDPFFGRSVRKIIRSEPVRIDVRPLPEIGRPDDFNGIVGRYTMNASLDRANVKTNEAVTFRITVSGQGNIRTLPELKPVFPTDFEVYPPKVNESINRQDGLISGSKTFEWVLVPRQPGRVSVKPVEMSIFDPSVPDYRKLRTESFSIDVERGEDVFISAPSGLSKEEVALLGQDIRFIMTEAARFIPIGRHVTDRAGFWIAALFPAVCLCAAILYRRHIERLRGDEAYARHRRAFRAAKRHLSDARLQLKTGSTSNFFAEVGRALNGFLGDKLNTSEAGLMTDEVTDALKKRGVHPDRIEEILDCIGICDMRRFSPAAATPSEMEAFLHRAEKAIDVIDRELSV